MVTAGPHENMIHTKHDTYKTWYIQNTIHTINCMYNKIASWRWIACHSKHVYDIIGLKIRECEYGWFYYTIYHDLSQYNIKNFSGMWQLLVRREDIRVSVVTVFFGLHRSMFSNSEKKKILLSDKSINVRNLLPWWLCWLKILRCCRILWSFGQINF